MKDYMKARQRKAREGMTLWRGGGGGGVRKTTDMKVLEIIRKTSLVAFLLKN